MTLIAAAAAVATDAANWLAPSPPHSTSPSLPLCLLLPLPHSVSLCLASKLALLLQFVVVACAFFSRSIGIQRDCFLLLAASVCVCVCVLLVLCLLGFVVTFM